MYGMRFPSSRAPSACSPVATERATQRSVAASSTNHISSSAGQLVQRVLAAVHGEPDLLARDRLAVDVSSTVLTDESGSDRYHQMTWISDVFVKRERVVVSMLQPAVISRSADMNRVRDRTSHLTGTGRCRSRRSRRGADGNGETIPREEIRFAVNGGEYALDTAPALGRKCGRARRRDARVGRPLVHRASRRR